MADISTAATEHDEARAAANPISMAHVLALSVPIHWTEAVAVIEELCLVLAANGDPVLVPDAHDVVITAQGVVMVHRGAPGIMDVDAIGRLLNTLLDPVTTPIPLRLFVAHSIGTEKYRSVAAYGEALAYYARPDRAELIQALYRRCLESSAVISPVVDEPIPLQPPPPQAEPEPLVAKRRIPRWLPLAAAFLLVVGGAFFVSTQWARNRAPGSVRRLAVAAAGVMQTVKQYVTIAPPPVTPAPSPVEAEDHRPARAARSQHAQGTPVSGAGLVPSPPAPFEPPTTTLPDTTDPPVSLAPQVLLPLESGSVSEGALALPPAVSRAESVVFGDTTIYTKASPDVQPPVLYSPKLPPVPPSEPDLLGTNTMELLIDETGTVQQALLKSRPVRLSDMMLLSPAKTWKFHPALKDGHPVKYRLTLSWVVAPP